MDTVKRMLVGLLSVCLCFGNVLPILAEEDYSDEDYWYGQCSKAQTSPENVKACEGFKEHQKQKKEELAASIDTFNAHIKTLEGETGQVEELAKQQRELKEQLDAQISQKEQVIAQYETQIAEVQTEIDNRQIEIDAWDNQIKTRMRQEQSGLGTNMMTDILMGASDLNDMLRKLTGLQRITEDDQAQITQLGVLKKQLMQQKEEIIRLEQDQQEQKQQLEDQQAEAAALEESYNQLVEEYQHQIAELQAQKRAAEADMEAIGKFVISASFSGTIAPVSGLTLPISGGGKSAGTWAYPGGGMHLGLDWAVPIGTQVVAPADGVILYANNPVPSNSGYLGNWDGFPIGGGNTVAMLVNLDGTLYGITFAHLSQEGMSAYAGQQVTAGQPIALTGNSGNSTGPHCHIEVINLGNISVEQAVQNFSRNADFSFGTNWGTTSTTCEAKGSAPCRERPEKFFS